MHVIVGMVSTYKEGRLAESAVRSLLPACENVYVMEGPIGEADPSDHDWQPFQRTHPRVVVAGGRWTSDAEKRTDLLRWTKAHVGRGKRKANGRLWGVIIDGDEALLWGEYLPDMIEHMEARERLTEETQLGCSLRFVEFDGSVAKDTARVLRLDYIDRYVLSGFHMLLTTGIEISHPRIPLLLSGEPDLAAAAGEFQRRRPLHGEPHILHRSSLRAPAREAVRQHMAEADEMARMMRDQGLTNREAPVEGGGVPIWLPERKAS